MPTTVERWQWTAVRRPAVRHEIRLDFFVTPNRHDFDHLQRTQSDAPEQAHDAVEKVRRFSNSHSVVDVAGGSNGWNRARLPTMWHAIRTIGDHFPSDD